MWVWTECRLVWIWTAAELLHTGVCASQTDDTSVAAATVNAALHHALEVLDATSLSVPRRNRKDVLAMAEQVLSTMRVELTGHCEPCTTEIYLHI